MRYSLLYQRMERTLEDTGDVLLISITWNAKCPIFLGNFTATLALKIGHLAFQSMFPPLWIGSSRGTGWCSDSGTSEGEARDGLGMDFLGAVFVWVFPKIGVPQNGWLIRENPIRLDDLGVHYFWKHPYWYQVLSFFFPVRFVSHPDWRCYVISDWIGARMACILMRVGLSLLRVGSMMAAGEIHKKSHFSSSWCSP